MESPRTVGVSLLGLRASVDLLGTWTAGPRQTLEDTTVPDYPIPSSGVKRPRTYLWIITPNIYLWPKSSYVIAI